MSISSIWIREGGFNEISRRHCMAPPCVAPWLFRLAPWLPRKRRGKLGQTRAPALHKGFDSVDHLQAKTLTISLLSSGHSTLSRNECDLYRDICLMHRSRDLWSMTYLEIYQLKVSFTLLSTLWAMLKRHPPLTLPMFVTDCV